MVDDEDYEFLKRWKWQATSIGQKRTRYAVRSSYPRSMHRLLLNVTDSKIQVDHIDGNGLNNQKNNLRLCDSFGNARNKRAPRRKFTAKYKGVYFRRKEKTYQAQIRFNYKIIYLGRFKVEEDAARAYNEAAKVYHGEFARLNII